MTPAILALSQSINPSTIQRYIKRTHKDVANANERKYAGVRTESDIWSATHPGVYVEIQSGSDNGECTSRRGTFCRLKTGDGRCPDQPSLKIRQEMDRKMRDEANKRKITKNLSPRA